jgi:hypothetical protein
MQDKHLFEYAVIRVVPRVEREEFLNVGVVLYCSRQRFLKFLYTVNEARLTSFAPALDIEDLRSHLRAFERIADALPEGGPIAKLDAASRFRWLTATRSTILQSSKVHPGLCEHPDKAVERLYRDLVD